MFAVSVDTMWTLTSTSSSAQTCKSDLFTYRCGNTLRIPPVIENKSFIQIGVYMRFLPSVSDTNVSMEYD